ncbi:proton-conducting transporter transmembrane domain-containing protein [Pyrococcus abyssi]|uniref:Hydrogenase 4, component F or formate hydrogen lyase, subunit 3 n=1 Tax=Pyrococcus abyssi (strain GE5 / Orsay) TaxID=272844 RepID=Q9UYP1_PYRAB|nr:proton-conducting transporter membrane subunit [Pyrococcus abyssi]CAB50371.1 Hydrogenase 4, component F or formate hydrogen lyase, subunit 3 [Pyrococcus abyssi GE5]CCE70915.1 TPA: putative monovalent cation/H+ antiporter subunit D [Pyrococcus abyssi GE5]
MDVVGLTPIIPLVFAFALPLFSVVVGGNRKIIQAYALLGTGLTLISTFKLFQLTYSSSLPIVYTFGKWRAPIGIVYEVDRLSSLIALVTAVLMFLIAIYSYRYLEREKGLEWYYTLYLGLESGLLGVLLTGDAFNLFVMIEVTSIAAYALVMFYRDRKDSVLAGLKYALIGAVGTTMYFLALGVFYGTFGTVNFADLSEKLHSSGNVVLASSVALVLATWAFLIKATIFPNHFWLPEAHPAAPSPISAILSGLVVNVGVYAMIRFLYTLYSGLSWIIGWLSFAIIILGAISSIFGALMMNTQRDVKRLVAYSTIMHMGYLLMAVGVGTQLGLQAALFHLINHAIAKALLFLAVGVFIHVAGSRNIDDLAGLGRKMPITTFSLAIATLSLVGIPPLNVFFSKLLLFNALLEKSFFLALVIAVTSVIALVAYMRVLYTLWLGKPREDLDVKESISMSMICLILALICIAIGLIAPIVLEKLINPAVIQAMDYETYVRAALP